MAEIKINLNLRDTALAAGGLATGWVVRTILTNKQWAKIKVNLNEAEQALRARHQELNDPQGDAVAAFDAAIAGGPQQTGALFREEGLKQEEQDPRTVCSLRKLYRTNSEYVETVRRSAEFNALHSPTCVDPLCPFRFGKIVPYDGAEGTVEVPTKWAAKLKEGHEKKTSHRMMENLSIDEDVDSMYVCMEEACGLKIKFHS